MTQAWFKHVVGFVGTVVGNSLCFSSLRTVLEAREVGSLGGLDARSWPLLLFCNLLWTLYAQILGDLWLWLSAMPPAVMWLWFCIAAVELMHQEEGELQDMMIDAASPFQFWDNGDDAVRRVSTLHRKRAIRFTEMSVAVGVALSATLAFGLAPRSVLGMEFLDALLSPEVKVQMLSVCASLSSLATHVVPVLRLRAVVRRRDASTIFWPLALAQLLSSIVWALYGLIVSSWSLIIPNVVGIMCASLQLALWVVLGRTKTEVPEEPEKQERESEVWASVLTSTTLGSPTSSTSEAPKPGSNSPALSPRDSTSTMSSPRSAASPHWGKIRAAFPSSSSSCSTTLSDDVVDSTNSMGDLPDLKHRLKEQGTYEDYLKWQRDYRRWRQGHSRGSRGELSSIRSQQSLPGVVDVEELDL